MEYPQEDRKPPMTGGNCAKSDGEFALYLCQMQQIDDRVNGALQRWLDTPAEEQETARKRNQEYNRLWAEGEAQKVRLTEAYWGKKVTERKRVTE